jgi:exonuclease SbcC
VAAALAAGERLDAASAVLAEAAAADLRAREATARMDRLTAALTALHRHEDGRAEHVERAARLDASVRAEPVRPLLAAAAEAAGVVSAARQDVIAACDAAGRHSALPDPGGLSEDDAAGLAAALAEAAAAAERECAALQHLAEEEAGLPARESALAGLRAAAEDAQRRLSALEADRQSLPGEIEDLEDRLTAAREAASGLDSARAGSQAIAGQAAAAAALADLAPELAAARAAAQQAVDEHQRLVDEHQRLTDERLAGIAAELAGQLSDGQPCPVCGSPAHPSPARPADGAVSAADIAGAAAQRDAAAAARERLEAGRDELASRAAALEALAGGRDAAELAAEAVRCDAAIAAAEQAAAKVTELAADVAERHAHLQELATEVAAASAAAAASRQAADAAAAELDELRERLRAASDDYPTIAARQEALREAATSRRGLSTALAGLAGALAARRAADQRAAAEAAACGFTCLDEASAAVADPETRSALDREVTTWETTLAALAAAAQASDLAGLDPADAGAVRAAAGEATACLAAAQAAEQDARAARDAAAGRADRFGKRMAEVARAEAAHDALVEETEPVIRLAGLAKGVEGHRRVALTTYVLRHWFEQVVAAANLRLAAMSSGRYQLRRSDEGQTRRQRAGLTLAVIDRHTGEERSPASLSGGETFYTSLALALGLADVVKAEAGGVDLETLFIDEGFGSLDPETLDQVMTVIDDLRDRGRVVGIVSHVADLKDRIPERLEVRRLPGGSSAARVVA